MLSLLWRFSRPHTLIGSTLSILSILILVVYCTPFPTQLILAKDWEPNISSSAWTLVPGLDNLKPILPNHQNAIVGFIPVFTQKATAFFSLLGPTLFACLLCNVFITGLNQLVDVELDKINKPQLPLAAGELSLLHAKIIVIGSGTLSVVTAWLIQPFLGCLITCIAVIGALYSLPPVQFKKYHIWAASAIAIVRGPLINVGIAIHFATLLYGPKHLLFYLNNSWDYSLRMALTPITAMYWLLPLMIFVTAFSLGIAWFKDIPDTLGDEKFGYKTLAVVWNKKAALTAGVVLVSFAYLFMAWQMPTLPSKIAHVLTCMFFVGHAIKVDLENPASVKRFYLFYWGLFFLEYLMLPILLM
jgi:homogentisate phytyltransferase/homogentisate geranylgeranyltransferase